MEICYITQHGVAERIRLNSSVQEDLTISFEPKCDGTLTLRSRKFAVRDGMLRIPLNSIADGEYHPRLEADTGFFDVEGFAKYGTRIYALKTDEETVRRLIVRCHKLEKMSRELGERVVALEGICQGHNIFNFERKIK